MKALSLTQPWATLVAIGAKQYETRGWRTHFRGQIAIHASKGFPKVAREICEHEPFCSALGAIHMHVDSLPLGCIVAVATVSICEPTRYVRERISSQERAFGNYDDGRFAIKLRDIISVLPIPAKGALSFWEVPPDIEALIMEQLAAPSWPDASPLPAETPAFALHSD